MATLAAVPFVSVEEYLHTVYEPDMDYVDGVLEDRNTGQMDHSIVQRALLFALATLELNAGVYVTQGVRTQTQATRFRVPDLTVVRDENTEEQIICTAPLLCIEVLSPEDRLTRIRTKCNDYLRMGVPVVWIFDSAKRVAYEMTAETWREVGEGELRLASAPLYVDVQAIFAQAERRRRPGR